MRRTISALIVLVIVASCSSTAAPVRDPGKVVQPSKKVAISGRLYATKGRALYLFSGTHLTRLLSGVQIEDPAVTPDGSRLAFAQLDGQSSVIVLADPFGRNRQPITPQAGSAGALWAFKPGFSSDGQQVAYVSDRGKQPSSPQNLQPNDLGVWTYDVTTRQSRQIILPVPYTGGDSDPTYRPGAIDQLIFTTYLYGGQPLLPVARLTWMSTRTRLQVYLSPDGARNYEPAISPDGHFLAFIHATGTTDDLYVMPLAASYVRQSPPYPTDTAVLLQSGMVSQPVWSSDGSAIAFMMLDNGSFDLFILPVNTAGTIHARGAAQEITHGSFLDADSRLAWGP